MALKKFVHQIPICSIIVNVLTVTESWDDGGNFVQLSLKLQDFWIEWPGYSICFILLYRFFG